MIDINLIDTRSNKLGDQISGLEALSQRVFIILHTKASEPLRSDEGTSLVDLIGTSQVDITYVGMILSSMVSEIVSIMSPGNSELPDDEALDTVYISEVAVNGDHVSFTLNVVSKSGALYTMPSTIGDTI